MINSKKSDGEYITPSCSILSIVEESMIAASPDPPSPQPTPDPSHLVLLHQKRMTLIVTPSSTITTMFGNSGKGQLIA